MNINWKIVAGVLAVALTYDEIIGRINNKRHERNTEMLKTSQETVQYLAHLLDENEYQLTEFDKMALRSIKQ